jgi:hypothetical protein
MRKPNRANDAFPNLSPGEREFILTGVTPQEWQQLVVGPPDDEEGDPC